MAPSLSLVICGRNDGHGGDFLHRLRVFVDTLARQAAAHDASVEVIFVEWNPPEDAPRMRNAIDWPTHDDFRVRIVEVPPEIHERYDNSDVMPIFQFTAKNVGIRHAEGDFLLSTNPDCLFNDDLFALMTGESLDRDAIYRLDRHDVEFPVSADRPVDERFAFCEDHVFRIHARNGTRLVDASLCEKLLDAHPLRAVYNVYHNLRSFHSITLPGLHTNASGDFILMARDAWHDIRGYPELTTQWHGDTYVCVQAIGSGLEEVEIDPPAKLYHQPHPNAQTERPVTDWGELTEYGERALEGDGVEPLNDEDWGLVGEDLTVVDSP